MIIYRALSLGAGVQSSTLALMLSEGDTALVDAGYTAPDVAVFADTGWEPGYVYTHLDWLEKQLSFPLIRVSAGNIKDDLHSGLNPTGNEWVSTPFFTHNDKGDKGMLWRQCTSQYKIKPIMRAVRERAGGVRGRPFPNGEQVEQWMGISTDEASRMRDPRDKWVVNRYPLIDIGMSRVDCQQWWQEHYPNQPLRRSACVICPYRNSAGWAEMQETAPDDFADAVEFDALIRSEDAPSVYTDKDKIGGGQVFLHASRKPLGEAVEEFKNKPYTLNMFENECEGICGV